MSLLQQPEEKKPDFEPVTAKEELIGQIKEFVWETVKVVVFSLAIIIPIRYFLIQPFYVKGASMEPNFFDHEYLVIDEISYRLGEVKRGDVVVFKYPNDPRQYFIKRVIGLPGETIQIKDGKIFIINKDRPEGLLLNESGYLPNTHTQGQVDVELAPGEYYVLGDNRASSLDSRVFGPISDPAIIGRAWVRGWPFSRLQVFNTPSYQ
ncbi:signal peptidase I [Candidatus Kuenenbacteria bacterium RIFCSPLOWO2_12_FULL_42_13]|uniref:Signal peptidase I n=3 Tax=Candidatus Kueneniibacteriota TaxID=1752740 RepID=A0A1F6G1N7_9BACT|nr:MAG: signal peptidase I [Candidatus Kuenenbacteria bacterium RIFCSPHIGHO2_02_FULL_42_29]OGG92038.1 MAG: signal peptidase I [Candidatus Kuenenbacteria bacterium RIFCSPLOWO2_12_FULL_42_13]OGG95741.1 MAG: signal peptidase I [Candidatus Kuenenbacteria bacterium RBG_16_41_7]OGG98766.1 MAG: signal peptidase I [Candidatus Kuenenbacteria bacterium RIFCSPHIGHO2_12_FULL_42_14]